MRSGKPFGKRPPSEKGKTFHSMPENLASRIDGSIFFITKTFEKKINGPVSSLGSTLAGKLPTSAESGPSSRSLQHLMGA